MVDNILLNYSEALALEPAPQWMEAIRTRFLPRVPRLIAPFYEPSTWALVEKALVEGERRSEKVYAAAWLLLIDSWLWLYEGFDQPGDSPFASLATATREIDEPALRIAHCIRDLAYGDASRSDDLVALVRSEDPGYRSIFERCHWREPSQELSAVHD